MLGAPGSSRRPRRDGRGDTMRYLPITKDEEREMLSVIGKESIDELFASIPERLRAPAPLAVEGPLSEREVHEKFESIAARNRDAVCFLGAGAYRHEIPAVVEALTARAEFSTAYTPYQPEISQGTLQAIFEWQSLICDLTGAEVANASMYDGATALAEAGLMALRLKRGRNRLLVSDGIHPHHRAVLATYCRSLGIRLEPVGLATSGATDLAALHGALDDKTAAVLLQSQNALGIIESIAEAADVAHEAGALLAVSVLEPVALGLVKGPATFGADIVTGDAGSLAAKPTFGGPSVGFFATRDAFKRQMPGRLAGETVDEEGNRGYVLTLATREQHIRRERATSNICSNQGLVMLAATITMSLYGRRGFRELARRNLTASEALKARIREIPGYQVAFSGETFNEFAVTGPRSGEEMVAALAKRGILAGPPLSRISTGLHDGFLLCATDLTRPEEIETLCQALSDIVKSSEKS